MTNIYKEPVLKIVGTIILTSNLYGIAYELSKKSGGKNHL